MKRPTLARPVLAVYWILILGGLLLFSAGRLDHADRLTPLWIGAIAGTAIGQFCAFRNLRFWLTCLILITMAYFSMPLMTAGVDSLALWKVLGPAVLCGYWSLGDRALGQAFWFPVVLWMLSILDRTAGQAGGQLVPDATGAALLVALALAFFLFLRVREARRVALWTAIAVEPVAQSLPPSTLKQPPAQHILRAGWSLAITASTALITAWIAPRLWQIEALRGEQQQIASRTEVGLPCCPSSRLAEMRRARVKEYLDLGLGHDQGVIPRDDHGPACEVCAELEATIASCDDCSPVGLGSHIGSGTDIGEITIDEPHGVPSGDLPAPAPSHAEPPALAGLLPIEPPVPTVAPVPTPIPTPPPPTPTPPSSAPSTAHAHQAPTAPSSSAAIPVAPRASTPAGPATPRASAPPPAIWPWLAVLAIAAAVAQLVTLVLRPLRRLILLRHLRDPWWPETIDQRISNAWHLALIGLSDAGWRPSSTEAPRELAARTSIAGVERCAVILERARHGLGLDTGDLSEMRTSAISAYASARAQLAPLTRALSWLRWPLI